MTLAEAITQVHNGNQDGLRVLLSITAPNLWVTVSMLCSTAVGTRMTEVYRTASRATASLHSPSDLRFWLCQMAYPMLLEQPDTPLQQNGTSRTESYRRLLTALPREERSAVLLLCNEGFSAAQAAMVLDMPEIEVKRAMRRARTALAERVKQERAFAGITVNTAWMMDEMSALRREQAQKDALFEQVFQCVLTNTEFEEQMQPSEEPPSGFLKKLFRTKR